MGEVAPAKTISGGISSVVVGIFGEQVQAVNHGASDGCPYFIETADGRVFSGRLDGSGRLPRIPTEAVDRYTVDWGEEALAIQVRLSVILRAKTTRHLQVPIKQRAMFDG